MCALTGGKELYFYQWDLMHEQAGIFIYFSNKSASQKMDGRCRFWEKKNSKPKGYFNECMSRILNFVRADAKLMMFFDCSESQDSGVSGTGLVDCRHVYSYCGINLVVRVCALLIITPCCRVLANEI